MHKGKVGYNSMENSSLFIRGQVWYWEDPIYGRKENNIDVSIGEATLRYNRYCIIAQTTESVSRSSVLVIPCSSNSHNSHDIPIPLAHLFHDNFTYARTLEIFPVHPKFLQRYICTLPESVMKKIEAELIKTLIPSLTNNMNDSEFLERFELDMDQQSMEPPNTKCDKTLETSVRSFIMEHVVKTDNSFNVSAYELRDAFNQYCMMNRLSINNDIVEFLDMFTKLTNNAGYHFSDRTKYNLVEFKGIRIRGNLKLSIEMNEKDIINQKDPQKPGKWNDQNIHEFLSIYEKEGIDSASNKFDLKASTALKYWHRWKDRLNNINLIKSSIDVPPTADIPKSISKISNMIRDSLKDLNVYALNIECEASINNRLSEAQFYSIIGTSIYYSLLDFLSIRKDDINGSYIIPQLDEYSENLETYYFFERVYHDRRISLKKNGLDLILSYRTYYPDLSTINPIWIDKLHTRLMNKLNMIEIGVVKICDIIKDMYCHT